MNPSSRRERPRQQARPERTVLGLDPGLAATGYGVLAVRHHDAAVIECGVLRTSPQLSLPQRLVELQRAVTALLARYRPDLAAVEKIFFNTNTTTAMAVSQARGVVVAACGQAGARVRECTPLEVKLAVSGYGRADKRQMQRMVTLLLKLEQPPQPDDAADALAIAIWGTRLTSW